MFFTDWLEQASSLLKDSGVPSARLDCLIIAEDLLNKDRSWLLAHPETKITKPLLDKLDKLVARRAAHEPLAYIRGKSEFYGRMFFVTPATLQPRPETETLVEMALSKITDQTVIDVGTGSGAIAITIKLEKPRATVYGTEINKDALKVATRNAKQLASKVELLKGNLLAPVTDKIDEDTILLCNLPYVPDDFKINKAAMQEPKVAIFGGDDGLNLYRKMFKQIDVLIKKPKLILTESLPAQHEDLQEIATKYSYKQIAKQDLIQVYQRS